MKTGVVVMSMLCAATAVADERKFTYSYESKVLPQGTWEFEQWATLKARQEAGHVNLWQFREEIEYGVTDRLTAALYLNWEYEAIRVPNVENEHEVEFETVSVEGKYKLLDAVADPVGLLLYAELGAGTEEQELELKLILDKQVGPVRLAYNFVVEFEREEEEEPNGEKEWEKESLLMHTFGISYQANPNFAVGAEAFFHQAFEGTFKEQEHLAFFIGPNIHVATSGWWATLTVLRQVDRGSDSELVLDGLTEYEVRLIVGVNF